MGFAARTRNVSANLRIFFFVVCIFFAANASIFRDIIKPGYALVKFFFLYSPYILVRVSLLCYHL